MIFLGLGTNIGNREENLQTALIKLAEKGLQILKTSTIYETAPWGYVSQENFLNLVVQVDFEGTAEALLEIALKVEAEMGRIREQKWGPRLIDIDVLEFHRQIIQNESLTLPHPLYPEREFVMQPLLEIAPHWQTTSDLIKAYQQTNYKVAALGFSIRVGEENEQLTQYLQQNQVLEWAFLTAWNPFSEEFSFSENGKRNEALETLLSDYKRWKGEGVGENSGWQPEESFFIENITLEKAKTLGRQFQQNALLWGKYGEPAQLIWLNP
ncbi:MAG: 2-amino-4-hydroxy-6-hydroxymethyldihydropteridine diphosphokinase [Bacteroidia bacterium]